MCLLPVQDLHACRIIQPTPQESDGTWAGSGLPWLPSQLKPKPLAEREILQDVFSPAHLPPSLTSRLPWPWLCLSIRQVVPRAFACAAPALPQDSLLGSQINCGQHTQPFQTTLCQCGPYLLQLPTLLSGPQDPPGDIWGSPRCRSTEHRCPAPPGARHTVGAQAMADTGRTTPGRTQCTLSLLSPPGSPATHTALSQALPASEVLTSLQIRLTGLVSGGQASCPSLSPHGASCMA